MHRFGSVLSFVVLAACVATPPAAARTVTVKPTATGTIESIPEAGILQDAPVCRDIQSTHFSCGYLHDRRGLFEFDTRQIPDGITSATLRLVETRGWSSYEVPPDTHLLSAYAADLTVDTSDFAREAVPIATILTDPNEIPGMISVDVTSALLALPRANVGFRIQLLTSGEGSAFGGLLGPVPQLEIETDSAAPGPVVALLDLVPAYFPGGVVSGGSLVTPGVILGGPDLDASAIDLQSLRVSGIPVAACRLRDVGCPSGSGGSGDVSLPEADGFPDLVFGVDVRDLRSAIEASLGRRLKDGDSVTLRLSARLKPEYGGTEIVDSDTVVARRRRGD